MREDTEPQLGLSAIVTPRSVAGKVVLDVKSTNASTASVALSMATEFGGKQIATLASGKSVAQVTATAEIHEQPVTATVPAGYRVHAGN